MKQLYTPQNIYKYIAIKKVFFTFFIILIYILGSNIVLPGINIINLKYVLSKVVNSSFEMSVTGFSINRLSLFSLGLGPWMSSMILWRVISMTKVLNLQNLTRRQSYQIKLLLSLAIGGIQSIGVLHQVNIFTYVDQYHFIALITILLSGLSILTWLGYLNAERGIGGPTVLVLINMMQIWPKRIAKSFSNTDLLSTLGLKIFLGVLLLIILSFFLFRLYQGELRLTKLHVMLDNKFSKQSYLPIPVNPGGGRAFMYAFSIMLLPKYIIYMTKIFIPNNSLLNTIYNQVQINHLPGVLILCFTVIGLSYGFAYVNIDYKNIAEEMKKSGDYFNNVYPGKNTERYIFHKVTYMTTISAFCNGLIVGIPMLIALFWKSMSIWGYLVPTWFMLLFLVYELKVQFLSLYHRNSYKDIID